MEIDGEKAKEQENAESADESIEEPRCIIAKLTATAFRKIFRSADRDSWHVIKRFLKKRKMPLLHHVVVRS
jgi:hypothetical protein